MAKKKEITFSEESMARIKAIFERMRKSNDSKPSLSELMKKLRKEDKKNG